MAERTPSRDAAYRRESIAPTYDHRETGDRFTIETRLDEAEVLAGVVGSCHIFGHSWFEKDSETDCCSRCGKCRRGQ